MKRRSRSLSSRSRKRRPSTVPATYLGFSLQATRFLAYLLKASPGDSVCLEVFEDVGVERADGSRIAEQDKSALSTNTLSNRSLDFWKTIRNWVDATASGILDPDKTRFVIYAPRAVPNNIAIWFRDARTDAEATAALQAARDRLVQGRREGETFAGGDSELDAHLRCVFGADQPDVARIVKNLTIEAGGVSPHDELQQLLLSELVSKEACERVLNWAHGWVKEKIDRLLERREPARVARDEFHAALLNHVRTHDRLDILYSVAGRPGDGEIASDLALRDYVRQLRIIGLEEVDVYSAVNDFLRAAADRTAWCADGLIDRKSLDTLAGDLVTTWRNKKRRVSIAYAERRETEQGQMLYVDCIEHKARLDCLETPEHFIRGSWHALADGRDVGWHPQYLALLEESDGPKGPQSPSTDARKFLAP
ncbi:MAG: ABC-three component system protein [Thermoguttaceae bacterium]